MISHAHYDHFGGLLWLEGHVPIAMLIDAGYKFPGSANESYSKELDDYGPFAGGFRLRKPGAYRAAHAGDLLRALDERLEVEVIAPPEEFFTEEHPEQQAAERPARTTS